MKQKKDSETTEKDKNQLKSEEKQKPSAEEYFDQLLKLKADFENYRKRVEKEKPELIAWGRAEMILKFLPLYDVILHAHEQVNKIMKDDKTACDETINGLCKGLDMIFSEFSKIFDGEGIRLMEVVGKPYDPMSHEVIKVVECDDNKDGLVIEEMQKGFICGSKVLRPAKVCIAKKKNADVKKTEQHEMESEKNK